MKLLLRWLVTAIALVVAVMLVPHIRVEGNAWVAVGVMAVVLGLVNALIRPLLQLLSCGCIVATLGLFVLVINGATLLLASRIAQSVGVGFVVDGFWPAFWGALVVSVVSFLLNMFVTDEE